MEDDILALLTLIEDAGRNGAIDGERMTGQALIEKALQLRKIYP